MWFLPGLTGKTTVVAFGPPADPPSPLPGGAVGFHQGWIRAGTAPGFTVGRGYDLFPERYLPASVLMLGGRDREKRG